MLLLFLACIKPDSTAPPVLLTPEYRALADDKRHETLDSDPLHHVPTDWTSPRFIELVIRYAGLLREDGDYHCEIGEIEAAQQVRVQQQRVCGRMPAVLEPPWEARRAEACAVGECVSGAE